MSRPLVSARRLSKEGPNHSASNPLDDHVQSQQPGAFRIRGNRASDHDDIISITSESDGPSFVSDIGPTRTEQPEIHVPNAEIVDVDAFQRAVDEAAVRLNREQQIQRDSQLPIAQVQMESLTTRADKPGRNEDGEEPKLLLRCLLLMQTRRGIVSVVAFLLLVTMTTITALLFVRGSQDVGDVYQSPQPSE